MHNLQPSYNVPVKNVVSNKQIALYYYLSTKMTTLLQDYVPININSSWKLERKRGQFP